MNQNAVIAFLSDPASFGAGVSSVERHETHGAIVFLAGDRAYKLKRAVHYPYMDFSTPALRRVMCERELVVNRRTAPQLYLKVLPIVRCQDGTLRFGKAGDEASAIDWVVVMRRFEQSALLEEMRKRNQLSVSIIKKLADAIAEFHRTAEKRPQFGGPQGILRVIDENIKILREWEHRPFENVKIKQFSVLTRKMHHNLSGLLEERRQNGFVRHCHGDLHLNNIYKINNEPVLFDAIEFSEDFSCIDVFYDLAFLLMDLEHHKLHSLANILLNRYVENTEDFEGTAALPLFLSCRAAVRAHVTATLADKMLAASASNLTNDAAAQLDDAIDYLKEKPPQFVVLGGLSGTGKSTLAQEIAPKLGRAPGAIILRSDVIRKKLCGVEARERLPQESYSTEVTARVYAIIAERAQKILAGGQSVIADAVYGHSEERRRIENVAHSAGVQFQALWLDAPLEVLEQRISARHGDVSDATVEVLHRQRKMVSVPEDWLRLDVSTTPKESISRACLTLNL
jgi:uncharacterized protein